MRGRCPLQLLLDVSAALLHQKCKPQPEVATLHLFVPFLGDAQATGWTKARASTTRICPFHAPEQDKTRMRRLRGRAIWRSGWCSRRRCTRSSAAARCAGTCAWAGTRTQRPAAPRSSSRASSSRCSGPRTGGRSPPSRRGGRSLRPSPRRWSRAAAGAPCRALFCCVACHDTSAMESRACKLCSGNSHVHNGCGTGGCTWSCADQHMQCRPPSPAIN